MIIELTSMRFHAPVGVYDFEQQQGNDIVVDVRMQPADYHYAGDDLSTTLNYAEVYNIVRNIVMQPVALLETVAHSIKAELCTRYALSGGIVRVSKLNPPLGGDVYAATVELKF